MIRLYELELEKSCPYGKNVDDDFKVLMDTCRRFIKDIDETLITNAYYFCVDEFKDINRISGDLYYTHPLKVALIMMEEMNFADNHSIAGALLHDVVEDREEITKEMIEEKFGKDIAEIVDGVTKIKGERTQKLDKAATYSKIFEALIRDVRVILIKLADRLDNLRTLHHMRESKQRIIGEETLHFYTPIAQRLGLIKIKRKLEDLSLYFANREQYEFIKKSLEEKQIEFLSIIEQLESQITNTLNDKNVKHALALEHKHIYEIYKMISQGNKLKDIDNFFSVVIKLMTDDFSECYRAYGIIANLFGPVRSFEDYFSKPKINFYKAIHSTHFSMNRNLVEVIIRTEKMDNLVETGMVELLSIDSASANFNFNKDDLEEWTSWMRDLVNEGEEDAIEKIWGTIHMNLDREYVTVYTPDRKDYLLPSKASPLDLAFAISEDEGLHCVSAKVNGHLQSMKYELQDDDVVEIISSPNSKPDEIWLNYVITFKAVVKLYKYFHRKQDIVSEQDTPKVNEVKYRVIGDDRPGMLNDISNAIGQINIMRINLYKTSDFMFEGIFTLNLPDESIEKELFPRLLSVTGIKNVEILDDEE